jgi:small neutral amino acid transporter SnatA (MarC family)
MTFSNDRIRRRTRLPLLIMGGFMVLLYFVLGGYIILNPTFLPKISKDHRTIFGGLLLVYGAYRSWRLYADHIKA